MKTGNKSSLRIYPPSYEWNSLGLAGTDIHRPLGWRALSTVRATLCVLTTYHAQIIHCRRQLRLNGLSEWDFFTVGWF